MTDPVNAQHMKAMGLDPAMLGQPVPEEKRQEALDRCPSMQDDNRCARSAHHHGDHVRGRVFWTTGTETGNYDPTAIPIHFDPQQQRMQGTAYHGNKDFDVPYMSQIEGNLWQGGCRNGLRLPRFIEHVVSLYQWEKYVLHEGVKSFDEVEMYDSADEPDKDEVVRLATLVAGYVEDGPTLVHCQAGLNRSGLIAAVTLIQRGRQPQQAINLLRSTRSDAVLCNPTFEQWLLDNF